MEGPIKERDWKYLRAIHDEMLHELCTRINEQAVAIVADTDQGNPHERYVKLCRHIQDSDDVIAACFNDWRRSTIGVRILALRSHGLLTSSHVQNLSDTAREWMEKVEELYSG